MKVLPSLEVCLYGLVLSMEFTQDQLAMAYVLIAFSATHIHIHGHVSCLVCMITTRVLQVYEKKANISGFLKYARSFVQEVTLDGTSWLCTSQ